MKQFAPRERYCASAACCSGSDLCTGGGYKVGVPRSPDHFCQVARQRDGRLLIERSAGGPAADRAAAPKAVMERPVPTG